MTLLLLAPTALAGTPDAPELTDAPDDCAFAPGNHYADVVAAWISDETATDFMVNLQLSKWTLDALGTGTGYTVQFTHQGVQFGIVAFYGGPTMGWSFATGFVDVQSGDVVDSTEAEGSFTAGTPALLSVKFAKSLFPHGDMADNKLVKFIAGTADFKPPFPVYVVEGASGQDVPAEPAYLLCDLAESTAEYVFQTGGHSMHGAAPADGNATDEAAPAAGSPRPVETDDAPVQPAETETADTPGPAAPLALAAVALAALAARRRR